MMAIGVLAFVIALLVSVMLHEGGHFVAAKLFGMKATQFFVGFGPTLWSRRRGETEYGIKAIPAGGYVKIIGMTPLEDVPVEDQPRAFINKPGWQRFIVLVAGSTMHFIIAFVLFVVLALAWATHDTRDAQVAAILKCAAPSSDGSCAPGAVPAPAQGVLEKGDVIVAVNGTAVSTAVEPDSAPGAKPGATVTGGTDAAVALIKAQTGPIQLTVRRHGTTQVVTITPVVVNGVHRIGVGTQPYYTKLGAPAALGFAVSSFGTVVTGSFHAMGKVPAEIGNVFSSHPAKRDVAGSGASVTSVVGVARVVGEGFSSTGVSGGLATLVSTIASVNLFVGIFNLLPFLPLDGGHVAILGYEKGRDLWRRRRHLAAAGPIDLNKLMPFTYGVLAIIVTMSALILFADISNPAANPFTQ
jgi:membrane-associated protease RseP (regulator of RpoE activity)